ncbi:hypothetical protein KOF112_35060 [Bacillus velezensis]|jgi:hypothetical protein|nr:hypothetical protein KOF112_35060 [Bacillus velezensis]
MGKKNEEGVNVCKFYNGKDFKSMRQSDAKPVKKQPDQPAVRDADMRFRLDAFRSFMIFLMIG